MQNEITSARPIFNENGLLAEPGWARQMYFRYDREAAAAGRQRLKEWDYYFIGSEEFGVSITINQAGTVGMLTAKLLNFREGYDLKKTSVIREDIFQPGDDEGTCYIHTENAEGIFIRKPGKHYIKLSMPDYHDGMTYSMDITLEVPETERMVIATPFREGSEYFFFNEKLNCLRASGMVTLGDWTHTFSPERDFAVLDFGRGAWPERNRWYWSSGSGQIQGNLFGFNLGYGFGDLSHATENMIFYKGRAHKLEEVSFDIPREGHMSGPWRIETSDGRFCTRFDPVFDRYIPWNLEQPGSLQHQVFGKFTGQCILDDGTVLELKDFFGFAEDVQNNWKLVKHTKLGKMCEENENAE